MRRSAFTDEKGSGIRPSPGKSAGQGYGTASAKRSRLRFVGRAGIVLLLASGLLGCQMLVSSWTYTITYNANGATSGSAPVDANKYLSGDVVTVLGNSGGMTKSQAAFAGWNTASDGSGTSYPARSSLVFGSSSVILYAVWTTASTYTITYDANGATGTAPTDSKAYLPGDTATVLGQGTLASGSQTFAGWNTLASGLGTSYPAQSALVFGSASVTLYAVWTTAPTYQIIYNANGGVGTVPADTNYYLPGDTATVLGAGTLAMPGHTFVRWNTLASGLGTSYAAQSPLVIGNASVTLYAVWTTATTYTVTYNANGATGTVPTDSKAYLPGDTATVLGQGGLTSGLQTFAGWNTLASGLGTSYPAQSALVFGSASVILYAIWTTAPTYNVTYNANGGVGTVPADPNNYLPGDTATVLGTGTLAMPGHTFVRWNTLASGLGTSYAAQSPLVIGSSSVTLFAIWTAATTYSVTYNANGAAGGSVPVDASTYASGAAATILGNTGNLFKSVSNDFTGWNSAANGTGTTYPPGSSVTMGAANLTLYAQFNSYNITYSTLNATSGSAPAASTSLTVSGNTGSLVDGGYAFAGWYDAAGNNTYAPGATLVVPTTAVNLDPVWVPTSLAFTASGSSIVIVGYPLTPPTGALTIPTGVTGIAAQAFLNCTGLTSVTLPGTLTSIGESAFQGCSNSGLTSVTIPASVNKIGDHAFKDCSSLNLVTMNGSVPPVLAAGDLLFQGCALISTSISVPTGSASTYQAAPGWSAYSAYIQ